MLTFTSRNSLLFFACAWHASPLLQLHPTIIIFLYLYWYIHNLYSQYLMIGPSRESIYAWTCLYITMKKTNPKVLYYYISLYLSKIKILIYPLPNSYLYPPCSSSILSSHSPPFNPFFLSISYIYSPTTSLYSPSFLSLPPPPSPRIKVIPFLRFNYSSTTKIPW